MSLASCDFSPTRVGENEYVKELLYNVCFIITVVSFLKDITYLDTINLLNAFYFCMFMIKGTYVWE